ncbi:Nucleoside-triphosphatase rdgB [Thermodesulfobacterium geofontis OPF15]|jgi:XTP/dITP diphosphohydrolase|uniref:dITP/XTP pyrophosphatase n=1 Tax=Thermodesulfobacterium geofontis (strain OPF15) TaxID=795359 RepID=F8C683_THEGP|nr:XTP/dITP diphosphatase [Thermodesulfobacterium geofontis]AEH23237.1 Nucleoside-triphosphatase rdgB [Thermodesulfobacterium geofontis OPF15]
MKKQILLIATSNMGKAKEISEALKDFDFEIKTLKDFPNITPPQETGNTFFENAYLKAKYYAEKTGLLSLADDSGLEVDILNGAPGIYSSRFAGENASDEENNKKLLELLKNVPLEKRKARFVCVIVVYHPSGKYIKSEGIWEGLIGFEPRGSYGFGYDPIFLVPEYNYKKTAAELPIEEKNKLSHRGKALAKLKDILTEFLKSIS